jgi:hypothetical protein
MVMPVGVNEMHADGGDVLSAFSQYGLAGLVILALFILVYVVLKEFRHINEMHNDRHDKRNELHAGERREWLQLSKENLDVNKENTALIKALASQLGQRQRAAA